MKLTSAELVVLSLVMERPRHGYDLERTIAERGIRQWADLAFSSIYYVLGRLESRGFVRSAQGEGATSRRIYSPTDTGRTAAADATVRLLASAGPSFSAVVLGLANVDLVDPAHYRALVRDRGDDLTEQIAVVEATRAAQSPLPRAAALVFSYTLAMLVAERDWLLTVDAEASPHED